MEHPGRRRVLPDGAWWSTRRSPVLCRTQPGALQTKPGALQDEASWERISRIEQVLRGAGDPGPAGDGGHHRQLSVRRRLLHQPAGEVRADERLVVEIGVQRQFTAGVQLGHSRAGAGAAR
jgi:hypothetical protein